jgi:hypothetical protein
MSGDVVVAEARGDGRGDEESDEQRGRPHDEATADHRVVADSRHVGPRGGAGDADGAADHDDVGQRRRELGGHGSPRRSGDSEIEAVDEQELEQEVQHVGGDRDDERGARVLDPAQVAGAGEGQQQEGCADDADAQVLDRERVRVRRRAHHVDDDRREDEPEDGEEHPEPGREPQPVDTEMGSCSTVAGAGLARDRGGGRVGEEVEDAERGGEDRPRDGEAGELRGPEVTDDRGVGEEVQRLRDQREERGNGQACDLAVVGAAPGDPHCGGR